jgi:glycosyltransferase involved in cell wall biosynthesis
MTQELFSIDKSMRILVHDYAGHPFQIELSRELARRGHIVRHVYSQAIETPRGELDIRHDDPSTLTIHGISLGTKINKYSFSRRFILEHRYGRLLQAECRVFQPDVVLSSNAPSLVQYLLLQETKKRSVRLVSWVQDLYGLAAYKILRVRIPVIGRLIGRYFMWLDAIALRGSSEVVVITEDFLPNIQAYGVESAHIHVLHNWAPLASLPVRPRDNSWARSKGLGSQFRYLYSGTLSIRHDCSFLLSLAKQLQANGTGEVVVVSQGQGFEALRSTADREGVTAIRFLPFQQFENMADLLGSADVLIALLDPLAGDFCVPSKVLTYLSAERPLLVAMPTNNLVARTVADNNCGLVVAPTDPQAFLDAASTLQQDSNLRSRLGAAARDYAEKNYDITKITTRFENILGANSAVPRPMKIGVTPHFSAMPAAGVRKAVEVAIDPRFT